MSGRQLVIGPAVAVGFDDAERPTVILRPGVAPPSPDQVLALVTGRRESLLREVAFLTRWLEAGERSAEERLVAPGPGDVSRFGGG